MNMLNKAKLDEIMLLLPMRIKNLIFSMNEETKCSLREIRLRTDKPIVAVTSDGSSFISADSRLTYILSDSLPRVSSEEISEILRRACDYSVYTHQEDMASGFVTVRGGSRIGICASAVSENGRTVSVRDVSSLNIRIAGEYIGCADAIVKTLYYSRLPSIIIAGAPMSGKTTVIRDLVRQLSDGNTGRYYKCAVLDERSEIAALCAGKCGCDVGVNTDVLCGFEKSEAVEIAVRSLSPDLIICDEVSDLGQSRSIADAAMTGVSFAVTAHCESLDELRRRAPTGYLLSSGVFDYAVFLGRGENLGKIMKIEGLKENMYENGGLDYFDYHSDSDGELLMCVPEKAYRASRTL